MLPRQLRRNRAYADSEVAILPHDCATALDAIGPYEVKKKIARATVRFVAKTPDPVTVDSGLLSLVANHSLDEVPNPEVVLVPDVGAPAMGDERVMAWIRSAHQASRWTTSVCVFSLLLRAVRLLDGMRGPPGTGRRKKRSPGETHAPDERHVREGKIVTAAGISGHRYSPVPRG